MKVGEACRAHQSLVQRECLGVKRTVRFSPSPPCLLESDWPTSFSIWVFSTSILKIIIPSVVLPVIAAPTVCSSHCVQLFASLCHSSLCYSHMITHPSLSLPGRTNLSHLSSMTSWMSVCRLASGKRSSSSRIDG